MKQTKKHETPITVEIESEKTFCCACGKPMRVQKTIMRKIITLRYGIFNARERVLECPAKCTYRNGDYVTSRSSHINTLAAAGSNFGYDIETYIGMERFIKHRQRDEIQKALKDEYSITISSGEVSALAARFLSHVEELHKTCSNEIRAGLTKLGGYPLHIDCTTEGGKSTLLVIYAGWQGWVLGSWKIPTESAAAIAPYISEVVKTFGEPIAIVRDLGQPMARAIEDAVDKMSSQPKILACHFHFLRDVGKDTLGDDHEHLRKLIQKLSVRENIRVVVRELRKKCDDKDISCLHTWFDHWIETGRFPSLPGGPWGMSLVISLGQWILDYSSNGNNLGFPFDRNYYSLYQRCRTANNAIGYFLAETRFDQKIDKALERLKKAFMPLLESKDVKKTIRELETRMELFDKLRNVFRFESDSLKPDSPNNIIAKLNGEDIMADDYILAYERFEKEMKNQVYTFEKKLKIQYENNRTRADIRHAINIILTHLNKHGRFLWGHSIMVQTESGCEVRLVDRTNNVLENFFREMKHGERRRSGRKVLTKDFEDIPAAASLAMNLKNPDYVKMVCGSIDKLPEHFGIIDQKQREADLNTPESEKLLEVVFNDWALVAPSDKTFVRKESVNSWIFAASKHKPVGELTEATKNPKLSPFEEMQLFLDKSTT